MTPENSEAPRESRGDLGLVERFDALVDRAIERNGAVETKVTDRLNGIEHVTQYGKVSSPELASLAAKYVHLTAKEAAERVVHDDGYLRMQGMEELMTDVRALAASVLAQAEGTPRK